MGSGRQRQAEPSLAKIGVIHRLLLTNGAGQFFTASWRRGINPEGLGLQHPAAGRLCMVLIYRKQGDWARGRSYGSGLAHPPPPVLGWITARPR